MTTETKMTIKRPAVSASGRRGSAGLASAVVLACVVCLAPAGAGATDDGDDGDDDGGGKHCSATATALFRACGDEIEDDYSKAAAICINVSDDAERAGCIRDAGTARAEGNQLCREQLTGRRDICELVGEERYDPELDPGEFDHDFAHLTDPNPYFPLTIGNRWEYSGGSETIAIEVRNETKLIDGVTCIVVRDTVKDNGDVIEDTDDWFAQAKDGNVWYYGEQVKDFESSDGDNPRRPELVSIDGSFKAGRDGDKPGIIFLALPTQGALYRQEFSLGNAEDLAVVLSANYAYGNDPELDQLVPQPLADLLCADNCVVIKEFTPHEPDAFERKYYTPGIGFFLAVNPANGTAVQLVDCNLDPRCALLPTP